MSQRELARRVPISLVAVAVLTLSAAGNPGTSHRSQAMEPSPGLAGGTVVDRTGSWAPAPRQVGGLSVVASVDDGVLRLHTAGGERDFLTGINLGATMPGTFPGQLDLLDGEQFARWLDIIGQIGARMVRIYTILPPAFYDELAAYNDAHPDAPLYLVQGVYLADEFAFVESGDLWDPAVRDTFLAELTDAHAAVTGRLERADLRGARHGTVDDRRQPMARRVDRRGRMGSLGNHCQR